MKKKLHLKANGGLCMKAFVDAAFGCHSDGKSHSGLVLMMGNACILAISGKQKLVTKSSTEAELVALSDMLKYVELYDEFVKKQGYNEHVIPKVMQDNQSTISLVTKGGGAPRNKHLRVRQNLVKQAVEMEQIEIEYMSTREMIADSLTKPLQGALLIVLNDKIMGKMVSTSGIKRQQGCVGITMEPGIRNPQNQYLSVHATAVQEKNSRTWKMPVHEKNSRTWKRPVQEKNFPTKKFLVKKEKKGIG